MKPTTIALWIVVGAAGLSRPAWGQISLASHEPACAFPAQALPAAVSYSQPWGRHWREPLPHGDLWASYCVSVEQAQACHAGCPSLFDRFCTFWKAPIEGCRSPGYAESHDCGCNQCQMVGAPPIPAVTMPTFAPQPRPLMTVTPVEVAPVVPVLPVVPTLEPEYSPPIAPGRSPIVELAPEPALPMDQSPAAPRNRVPQQRNTLPVNRVPK